MINSMAPVEALADAIRIGVFKKHVLEQMKVGVFDPFLADLIADEVDSCHDKGMHTTAHDLDDLYLNYCELAND